jgi:hypothetical protein
VDIREESWHRRDKEVVVRYNMVHEFARKRSLSWVKGFSILGGNRRSKVCVVLVLVRNGIVETFCTDHDYHTSFYCSSFVVDERDWGSYQL